MTAKLKCSSCKQPTTGRSRANPDRALCAACQPRPLKTPTLASMAKRPGSRPRTPQCSICLEPESFAKSGRDLVSSLKDGKCRDRLACEARQPPLIQLGEVSAT